MSQKLRYKIGVRVIPFVVYWLMRCWFKTCRTTIHGYKGYQELLDSGEGTILSCWHYSIAFHFYTQRKDRGVAMVSASRDGEYIARLAGHYGFDTVRGSSNSQGMSALKKLLRKVKEGNNAAIVADGSQGPPLKLQAGAILLASRTGRPILPIVWSGDRYIAFDSWDRMILPKPFSRVEYFYGDPFYVPAKIGQEELEKYRIELDKILNDLYGKAWQMQGKTEH